MKRRNFIAAGVALGGATLIQASAEIKRPDILLIMSDQHFGGAMSCMGDPNLKTPNLDALAERGVRFDKAYSTQPLCIPSRTSMQTGRYPHQLGVTMNIEAPRALPPMLGRLVADAGYDCPYIGKWHVTADVKDESVTGYRYEGRYPEDAEMAVRAAEIIRSESNKPRFLTVSFTQPHDICGFPRKAKYAFDSLPYWPPKPGELPPLPQNHQPPAGEYSFLPKVKAYFHDYMHPTSKWRDQEWREYLWAYYRYIEDLDRNVGTVMQALKVSGRLENTVVIYVSDHGDGMGAHQWNQKGMFYEECVRVPIMISGPGIQSGQVRRELVSTGIDLLPTLCDFAGASVSRGVEGKSLKPIAEGGTPGKWRNYVISETDFSLSRKSSGITGRMIFDGRYKYMVFNKGDDREMLFDLQKDPGEMNNVIGVAEYAPVLKTLQKQMIGWAARTEDSGQMPNWEPQL